MCEIEISHMGKNNGISRSGVREFAVHDKNKMDLIFMKNKKHTGISFECNQLSEIHFLNQAQLEKVDICYQV